MARPKELSIKYFTFDVDLFEDEKVLPVSVEYGAKGEAVVVRLLCAIYREGYFTQWSEGLKFKIANQAKVSEQLVSGVVLKLVKYHFFDEELFTRQQVLTSAGIQKRWNEATRKRVEQDEKPFWIIGEKVVSTGRNDVSGGRNPEETPLNKPETPQSILNKKKGNISPNGDCENPPDLPPEKPPEDPKDTPREKINYREIVSIYHQTCNSFPEVKKLTDARKDKIRIRINEFRKQFPDINYLTVLKELFAKMEASEFLRGNNKNGWKASFDWIFENGKNWVKIYEGNYDNKSREGPNQSGGEDIAAKKERIMNKFFNNKT